MGVLLKNLNDGNCVLGLDLNQEHVSVALTVIRAMARLHAYFWGQGDQLPKVRRTDDAEVLGFLPDFLAERFPIFLAKWTATLDPEDRAMMEESVTGFAELQREMCRGNGLTFCHGDVKSANIFYKRNRDSEGYVPVFLDWQHCVYGKGVQDLVFFMIESFDIEFMNATRVEWFTCAYYDALCEYGVGYGTEIERLYSRTEFMADFARAVHHVPLFVTIWFGSMDADELIVKEFPGVFLQKYLHFARLGR